MNTAIVVGGGIGGLSAAIGLERAGWQVTVLERAEEFRPVGAGLTFAPNGVRALDWLGVGEQLRAHGMAQGAAGIRAASGRWLLREDLGEIRRRFGVSGYMLHRADVHAMLIGALRHADLRTGHQVTDVDPDTGTVEFQLTTGGTGTATADLVVAADGLHSPLRTRLFPGYPGPTYAGYLVWRGVVPSEAAAGIELGSAVSESWGRGQRFGIVPLLGGQVYWFATLSALPGSHTEDDIEAVARRFRNWHDPIPRLLAATPPEALLRHDIYSLETPLPRYFTGRVLLLGDAAHAVTPDLGQGAVQALEDAATLGGLAAQHGDVSSIVDAYDRARRARTQRLVRVSASTGRMTQWRHPVAAAIRDTLTWLTPSSVYLRTVGETFSWTPDPAWPVPEAR
ncbi:FAD-dependent monooxygenase [Amycolatopsis taiwanensis]|uniref:FAD-dependent oxidoreductase n=1 Tax=Amycolatopsis taiwanensis TaxID=342230 RepID=A0A9W6QVN6_9PSEU|nr:FAD-dependent monooxygenase [Amycolatopsis taiwanensis]GLY64954.1 FAD-dependent oxidoreductase [Amycolatopsis taiwanensis]